MEPVALGVQTPDIFGKLSQILSIKAQKQGLEGQAAEVKSTQQGQRQREALSKYDFSKHLGDDGTPDLNSLMNDPELRAAAGDQFLDVISKAAGAKQQQLQNKQTLVGLRNDQREAFASLVTALRSDSDVAQDNEKGRQKLNEAMVQYGEMYGEDVLPVLSAYAGQLQKVPKGKLGDALKAVGLQAMTAGQQLEAQKPQYANTGGQLTNVSPYAAPGAAPSAIPLTLSPGEQDQPKTDQLGNPYRELRDQRGNITGTAPIPGAGGQGGPAVFGVGERASFEQQANKNFENVNANRTAASMAPQQLDQIDKALELSKQVSTGSAAPWRAKIESGIGSLIPGFAGLDDASKLQELDKFAERIATDASRVLGVNAKTDAERESIHKQNANIGYTPKAIQAVLGYAKAQTMAIQAKGDAQENWLKQEGSGITKQHEFETKFRQAYDPRIFQYAAMPADEKQEYIKNLSKEDRAQIAEKTRKLRELGALPNAR